MKLLLVLLVILAGCAPEQGLQDASPDVPADLPETTYERNNPQVVKGLLDPGNEHIDAILSEQLGNVKALGINTLYFYADYSYIDGEFALSGRGPSARLTEEEKETGYKERIAKAKNKGFAVHVATAFGAGQNSAFNVPLEQFLKDAMEADLKWAAIAEEYKAESFAPSSEIDFQIFREYFGGDWKNHTAHDEAAAISNDYHAQILPQIRNVYNGTVIYQAGLWNPTLGVEGYDLFGTGVNSVGSEVSDFRERVREVFSFAQTNARRQGSGWMVTELWIPVMENTGDPRTFPALKSPSGVAYAEVQDELYKIVFEEYTSWNGSMQPSGLAYISYLNPIARTKDTPSEDIIREFFLNLK